MSRGWPKHFGANVGGVTEAGVRLTVEEEDELMLGMRVHDALHGLMREPADAFQLVREEQAGVDYDAHAEESDRALLSKQWSKRQRRWKLTGSR